MRRGHIIYNSYSPWVYDLGKASGDYLWTKAGAQLIDFSSGWNVANLGWNHPEIADAVVEQAKHNVYAPMWSEDEAQHAYADRLTAALPKSLSAVGRATGGTEANEMAMKMARAKTGRRKIIGIRDSYHGQSFGTMSLGFRPEYVKAIAPLVPEFVQLDFPSSDRCPLPAVAALAEFGKKLEDTLAQRDVAAVLTEAGIVTGWGTASVAPVGYLRLVRELTEKYGTLLIVDEVGTGMSRCGRLFAVETEQVEPDFVTLAKGISNGAGAIGAVVTTNVIADATFDKATLTSTFGWTPLACAAALKTLEIHQRDKVWIKSAHDGEHIVATLRQELKGHGGVKDIRGVGMEIGIQLDDPAKTQQVVKRSLDRGLHIAETGEHTLQLMPPLTINRAVLDQGLEMLVAVIRESA